jgi:NAD(P)-dependent dehydrogenase (short-subunit alcohol dehydrogenase family)
MSGPDGKNRVALVTGVTRGSGMAIAQVLAAAGYTIDLQESWT